MSDSIPLRQRPFSALALLRRSVLASLLLASMHVSGRTNEQAASKLLLDPPFGPSLPTEETASLSAEIRQTFAAAQAVLDKADIAVARGRVPDRKAVEEALGQFEELIPALDQWGGYALLEAVRAQALLGRSEEALMRLKQAQRTTILNTNLALIKAHAEGVSLDPWQKYQQACAFIALALRSEDSRIGEQPLPRLVSLKSAAIDLESILAEHPNSGCAANAKERRHQCLDIGRRQFGCDLGSYLQNRQIIMGLLNLSARAVDWRKHLEKLNAELPPELRMPAEGPPPNDASPEILVLYWADRGWREGKAPPAVQQRLLTGCAKRPQFLLPLLPHLPETPEAHAEVQRILDTAESSGRIREGTAKRIREWLNLHGLCCRDRLIEVTVSGQPDSGSWMPALGALARLDWEAAKPILGTHIKSESPKLKAHALSLVLREGTAHGETRLAELARQHLKDMVEDQTCSSPARAQACAALLERDWPGRDAWYVSLFSDPSLNQVQLSEKYSSRSWSPLLIPLEADPDHWIPVIAGLIGDTERAKHNNAVLCFLTLGSRDKSEELLSRKDLLLPLLPWLTDPEWTDVPKRLSFVRRLDSVNIPEAVPGLIQLVKDHLEGRVRLRPPPGMHATFGNRWELEATVRTLSRYADSQAAMEIVRKGMLHMQRGQDLWTLAERLAAPGALSPEELARAIETYVRAVADTHKDRDQSEGISRRVRYSLGESRLTGEALLGYALKWTDTCASREDVSSLLIARAEQAEHIEPRVAEVFRLVLERWTDGNTRIFFLERLIARDVTPIALQHILEGPPQAMRKKAHAELRAALAEGSVPAGFAATILGSREAIDRILDGTDRDAICMLLACARLARLRLDLQKVKGFVERRDGMLSLAAMLYLFSEDSPEANQVVQELFPGTIQVTGATGTTHDGLEGRCSFGGRTETRLVEEMKGDATPQEIHALVGGFGPRLRSAAVYLRPDEAEIRVEEGASDSYRSRMLTETERRELVDFTTIHQADRLPPLDQMVDDGVEYTYVHLTKNGGRRVYMNNPNCAAGTVYDRLTRLFLRLAHSGRFEDHYPAEAGIPGLKLILSGPTTWVQGVWCKGHDLRVLVSRSEDEGGRWHSLADGKLDELTASPPAMISRMAWKHALHETNGFPYQLNRHVIHAQSNGDTILSSAFAEKKRDPGLWCYSEEKGYHLLAEGMYASPIVTPNGQWLVAAKAAGGWSRPNPVVRMDLRTGKEQVIDVPPADTFGPIARVPGKNTILLHRRRDFDAPAHDSKAGPRQPEYRLLDPTTGESSVIHGNPEPLEQIRSLYVPVFRALQPTGRPGQVWVSFTSDRDGKGGTAFGHYSLETLNFEQLAFFPKLFFHSMDMWVDEPNKRIFVVDDGKLLRLPLRDGK